MKNSIDLKSSFASFVKDVTVFFDNLVQGKRTMLALVNTKETASGNASNLIAFRALLNKVTTFMKVSNASRKDNEKFDLQTISKVILGIKKLDALFVEKLSKDAKGNDVLVKLDSNEILKAKARLKVAFKENMLIAFNLDEKAYKTFDFSDAQVLSYIKVIAKHYSGIAEYVQPIRVIKAKDKAKTAPNSNAKRRRELAKGKAKTMTA